MNGMRCDSMKVYVYYDFYIPWAAEIIFSSGWGLFGYRCYPESRYESGRWVRYYFALLYFNFFLFSFWVLLRLIPRFPFLDSYSAYTSSPTTSATPNPFLFTNPSIYPGERGYIEVLGNEPPTSEYASMVYVFPVETLC